MPQWLVKGIMALVVVWCFLGIVVVGFGAWLLSGMVGEETERDRWRDGRL